MNVIQTESLCKSYGRREVLHGLSVVIDEAKLVGFLGPNGAGKTTTIRVLLGLLKASSGRASLLEQDCWSAGPAIRREIGYLPGELHFYRGLTGRQTLEFLASARKIDCRAQAARLQERFDLDLDVRVRSYSSGMKQKLGLIQALMHRPRLLILDEPTNCLDPLIRRELYAELRSVADEGRTVLFSSHTLSEVDELCEEVIVLRAGRMVEHDRVDSLRQRAPRRVELVFSDESLVPHGLPARLERVERTGARIRGRWSGEVANLLHWLRDHPEVRDVTLAPPDLEDLFLDYYSEFGEAGPP
jgi:ABC-2 type transport system ATP-binding protein